MLTTSTARWNCQSGFVSKKTHEIVWKSINIQNLSQICSYLHSHESVWFIQYFHDKTLSSDGSNDQMIVFSLKFEMKNIFQIKKWSAKSNLFVMKLIYTNTRLI